jgi:hypothetical protein
MYYSYESIDSLCVNEFIVPDETQNLIKEIKKILMIYHIEPLKPTIINKPQDYCGAICKLLNKLSEKNYEKLKKDIFEIIDNVESEQDIHIITKRIFDIASNNINLSRLFSKLYHELIQKNNSFYDVFHERFIQHTKMLSEIKYISPNEDYDEYCNYVKSIDRLKCGLFFFSNLMKYKIGTIDHMCDLCLELLNTLTNEMKHKENMEYKEELLQSIFIIIKETHEEMYFHSNFEIIYTTIVSLKTHENINPKLKFKCLDIIDFCNHQT